jgi:anaerobic selenocysteine-containing dehydrogenase
VVLPVAEHRDEIVWRGGALTILAEDGSGSSWEPIRAGAASSPDLNDTTAETGTAPEAPAETAVAAETVTAAPAPPRSLVWDRSFGSTDVPGRDAYALRLVTGHTLYDGGRTVISSPPLAGLVQPRALRVSATDLTRIGVDDGATVHVTSSRGTLDLTVHADGSLAAGVARLDFSPSARGAADLIDVTVPVTDVRVETQR